MSPIEAKILQQKQLANPDLVFIEMLFTMLY